MQRNYNDIYAKIVQSDSDFIGQIAYSQYKKHKIEYIEGQNKSGITITDADLVPFNNISKSDTAIDAYRIKAEILLQNFLDNALEESIIEIEKEAVAKQSVILQNIVKPLEPKFWVDVWASFVSAFIFAVILALIALILQFQGSSINIEVKKQSTENTK